MTSKEFLKSVFFIIIVKHILYIKKIQLLIKVVSDLFNYNYIIFIYTNYVMCY